MQMERHHREGKEKRRRTAIGEKEEEARER